MIRYQTASPARHVPHRQCSQTLLDLLAIPEQQQQRPFSFFFWRMAKNPPFVRQMGMGNKKRQQRDAKRDAKRETRQSLAQCVGNQSEPGSSLLKDLQEHQLMLMEVFGAAVSPAVPLAPTVSLFHWLLTVTVTVTLAHWLSVSPAQYDAAMKCLAHQRPLLGDPCGAHSRSG